MAEKSSAVFAVYPVVAEAETGVGALQTAGFGSEKISVLFVESSGSKDREPEKESKIGERAAEGAGVGSLIGGALGVLAGTGLLTIPGLGSLVTAGPIMAGLAGLGIGGALGGIAGALIGMGVPEYEAKSYESRIKEGGILLAVQFEGAGEMERAQEVLERTGAHDIAFTIDAVGDLAKTTGEAPSPAAGQ